MPPSILFRVLSKLRAIMGGAGFHSLHFRFIWSILKRLIRWMPSTYKRGERRPPPVSDALPTFMRLSGASAPACATQHVDMHSVDVADGAFPHEDHISPANDECIEHDRPSTSSLGDSTYGVDRLQPTTMEIPSTLRPILPKDLVRYEEDKPPVTTQRATFTVKPLQTVLRADHHLPPGWEERTQCEGQVFFYNPQKNIISEAWLYSPGWRAEITRFIQMIDDLCEVNELEIPQNSELVLEPQYSEEQGSYCGYYFAHHDSRSIFWLHSTPLEKYLTDIKGGSIAPEHAKVLLEREYWRHFALFEAIHTTPKEALCEIRAMILDGSADLLFAPLSTVPHSENQLGKMAKLIEGAIKDLQAEGRGCPFAVGRIMTQFQHERFINFHGQPAARLARNKSIYGTPLMQDEYSWLISILSPVLFNAPRVQLIGFDKIWVDEVATREPWIKLIEELTSEWAEHTTFATILLNANVAFLEVPGVGPSQPLSPICFYISIVLVLGSAVLGLILKRQHSTNHLGTADEAAEFFSSRDLETTAILYSLPYALLMYGLVTFSAGFLLACFSSTSSTPRVVVGIFLAFTIALIVWCLSTQWKVNSVWQGFKWSECEKVEDVAQKEKVQSDASEMV